MLYKGPWYTDKFLAWSNVSQHGLNSLFALFEILVPRTAPMPWVHVFWLILMLLGYLGVAYITVATEHWYTYSFLNYQAVGGRGIVAAYIIGIAVGIVVIFSLVKGLVWLRQWVMEKKLCLDGKFAGERMNSEETSELRKSKIMTSV